MFDPATARDLADALRLLQGHRRLSAGATEILRCISGSGRVSTAHPLEPVAAIVDGRQMGPVLLTYDEAADHLRSSAATVKRLVKAGRLRAVHVGAAARIHSSDLFEFMEDLRCEADVFETATADELVEFRSRRPSGDAA